MCNVDSIKWNRAEDLMLRLNVEKYGTANWFKIFFNLYTKHTRQIKLRWKGWNQPNIQKGYWKKFEDILVFNSMVRCIPDRFPEKFYCSDRSLWQCFFRGKLFLALNRLKHLIKPQQLRNLYQNIANTELQFINQFDRNIEIQFINNGYFLAIENKARKFISNKYYQIQKKKQVSLAIPFKQSPLCIGRLKKLFYKRLLEQHFLSSAINYINR